MKLESRKISVDKLLLDPDNPRLPSNIGESQAEILDYIARKSAIEDLMSAIGQNGFFDGESLAVYRNEQDKAGMFRVIEGNRRLTAVKLLSDPDLCPTRKIIADIAKEAKHKPTELPVFICPNRNDILPYLGSRHIVGVRAWEPLSKARYMEQLFLSIPTKKASPATRYKEVAKMVGSTRSDFIKRNLDALAVFNLIEKHSYFDIADLSQETVNFSVLSTALAYPQLGDFVGTGQLDDDGNFKPSDPIVNVAALKLKNIREFSKWLFERDEKGNTVLGDSRNIGMLAEIVETPKALQSLRNGAVLKYAYGLTRGIDKEFLSFMETAKSELQSASAILGNTKTDQRHLDLAMDTFEIAKTIARAIRDRMKETEKDRWEL